MPPSGLGISARLTGLGLYFPLIIRLIISSTCSFRYGKASSTVIPSTPGAPPFFFTFLYAALRFSLATSFARRLSAPSSPSVSAGTALCTPLLSLVPLYHHNASLLPQFSAFCAVLLSWFSKTVTVRSFPFMGTMTSADFPQLSRASLHRLTVSVPCGISTGKHNDLRLIYLPYLRCGVRAVLDFVLLSKLVHPHIRLIWFLFVRPRFCLRLPSDSTSRWTPLPLANSSYCQACSGLSPPSHCTCRAH